MDKQTLREQIREKRKTFDDQRKKAAKNQVIQALSEDEHFLKADFVGIYHPGHGEMNLTELIEIYPNKIFGYPKIVNDKIMYLQVDKNTVLKRTSFGIYEPQFGFDITDKLEVVIVPSLGLTESRYRLGYGKGYFDRFFKQYANVYKIGVIYEGEIVSFEPSSNDVQMDDYFVG